MSSDELLVLIVSAAVAILSWSLWYLAALRIKRLGAAAPGRALLLVAPALAVGLIVAILRNAAASDVRHSPIYLLLYGVLGAAWLALAIRLLPFVGVSARDDVIERGNRSAAYVVTGALVGFALAFAGGNVGNGPGWWVVVFSSGLATIAVLLLSLALEGVTAVSEVVTVDRDPGAGLRVGGFLVAAGTICGRAAAGDWVSVAATTRDFLQVAQPALLLLIIAIVVERLMRPTPEREASSSIVTGVLPAATYIGLALAHVVLLGPA